MAYTPTTWVNDTTPALNATNLNKMETGIDEAHNNSDKKPFLCTDDTGDQSITGTEATCNLTTVKVSNANYSLATNEITITDAGTYFVSYSVNYQITNTSGGTRGAVTAFCQTDDSGAYATIPGSYSCSYHREASGQSGNRGSFVFTQGNATKKLRIRHDRTTGTTNVDTIAAQVSLTILKV